MNKSEVFVIHLCWILLIAAKCRSNCRLCSDNLALSVNFLAWSGVEAVKPDTSKAAATIWRPFTGWTWTWWWWWWWWWCLWTRFGLWWRPGWPWPRRLTFTLDEEVEVAGEDWSVLKTIKNSKIWRFFFKSKFNGYNNFLTVAGEDWSVLEIIQN